MQDAVDCYETNICTLSTQSMHSNTCAHKSCKQVSVRSLSNPIGESRILWRTRTRSVTKPLLNRGRARRSLDRAAWKGETWPRGGWWSEMPKRKKCREERRRNGGPDTPGRGEPFKPDKQIGSASVCLVSYDIERWYWFLKKRLIIACHIHRVLSTIIEVWIFYML